MPYNFSPYHDAALTQTIASLLERQGEIPAQAALQRGQAWGNAATGIAAIASQIPQEIRRNKLADSELKTAELKRQELEQQMADQKALDAAVQSGDLQGAIGKLPGHLQPAMLKQLQDANEHAAQLKKLKAETKTVESNYLGGLGFAIQQNGYDPVSTRGAIVHAKQTYADDPEMLAQITQIEQQVSHDPSVIKSLADGLVSNSEKYAPLAQKAAKDAADLVNTQADNARLDAQASETAKHNREMERIATLTQGREAARDAEIRRHNLASEPPAWDKTGPQGATVAAPTATGVNDTFLSTLPTALADKVKALVEGRLSLPSRFSKGDPYWESILDAAVQYDPSFDATNYNSRSKARADLTSPNGVGGRTINALNTALQHAGKLSDLIEQLNNAESPLVNMVVNPASKLAGGTAVTNFNAVAPQLMKEIERAWRGTGGSTADIQQLIGSIGPNMGRQQQREALSQFVELVQGKLAATEQQRDNAMGPTASKAIPILFDQNKPVIAKIQTRASTSATPTATTIAEGTEGTVNGKPAVWRQGTQGLGWYEK